MHTGTDAEIRTVVENVSWETYVSLADNRPGGIPRMTFDQGALELMSPKKEHEKIKSLLGKMVNAFCETREIEIECVASTTFRRQDLDRGFEADESYYFVHADTMRTKIEIDLTIDPPPELVIEVEITSSAIAKMDLFAAMGVCEVWRHDGHVLNLFRLERAENSPHYQTTQQSVVLAGFPVAAAERLLAQRLLRGENSLMAEFRSVIG